MIESIVSYGLAVGAVYAMIGITYNVMFSASRVFSFTSGMLGMLGGVLGALFITKFGLPVVVGRAFVAIAEDNYAARALGLPEQGLRVASFALAGIIGMLAGFTGAEMLLAFFGNQSILNFYGFIPVALGGMGSNRGAVFGGLALGLFQQAANFLLGGIFAAVAVFVVFIAILLVRPEGLAGVSTTRRV